MIFFFVGKASSEECLTSLNTFLFLADSLGVPIKEEKTEHPTTCVTIYGIEIDSSKMEARLPWDKVDKMFSLIQEYRYRRKLTLHELQSLFGIIEFCLQCHCSWSCVFT